MNLLAHIYLSGDEEQVKIGNFIGDYVKGKRYEDYRPLIKKGILLHRSIDAFTDRHKKHRKVSQLLSPFYRKYAGIVVDIIYDHFLSIYWSYFSDVPLDQFVSEFHQILRRKFQVLPASVQSFVPRMIDRKRLLSYQEKEGVKNALQIMAKYTSLPDRADDAIHILSDHYDLIGNNFLEFFPQLIEHVRKHYDIDLRYCLDST